MFADKEYAQYLNRRRGIAPVPCPLACALEFMGGRAGSGPVVLQDSTAKIKQAARRKAAAETTSSNTASQAPTQNPSASPLNTSADQVSGTDSAPIGNDPAA